MGRMGSQQVTACLAPLAAAVHLPLCLLLVTPESYWGVQPLPLQVLLVTPDPSKLQAIRTTLPSKRYELLFAGSVAVHGGVRFLGWSNPCHPSAARHPGHTPGLLSCTFAICCPGDAAAVVTTDFRNLPCTNPIYYW
jgi:hypothetical protein